MRSSRLGTFFSDIGKHPYYYAIWLFLLIVGISCGYASMRIIAKTDASSIVQSITQWLQGFVYGEPDLAKRILPTLLTHGRWFVLLILAGLFRFGSLFVFAVPLIKGFGMGVVAGMLRVAFGFRGVLLALAVLSLQNLLLIPCFVYTGSIALTHIRIRLSRHKAKRYMNDLMLAFIFFIIALIIDITVIPYLMSGLGSSFV